MGKSIFIQFFFFFFCINAKAAVLSTNNARNPSPIIIVISTPILKAEKRACETRAPTWVDVGHAQVVL